MELTRRQRAQKALEHAQAGVVRARRRCERTWAEWLVATEDRRSALEIEVEAEREVRLAKQEEEAVPHARPAPAAVRESATEPASPARGDFVPDDEVGS